MKKQFITLKDYILLLKDKMTICVKDYKKYQNGVINRHDVDYSLDLAYELSQIEFENNINATYYILLTSDLYNVFTADSKRKIEIMLKQGFEIGLHFDPTIYGNLSIEQLIEKMKIEILMFENFFGTKIYSYSMHNPSISGVYIKYRNIIDAYDKKIFDDFKYISDSCFSFKSKIPKEFLKKSKKSLIQLLTHPVHFFSDGKISYEKPLNLIVNNYLKKVDKIWSINNIYKKQKKNYKIDLEF